MSDLTHDQREILIHALKDRVRAYYDGATFLEPVGDTERLLMTLLCARDVRPVIDPHARISRCEDCRDLIPDAEVLPARDLSQRVVPGEPMPSGECPACGALCHPAKEASYAA